MGITFKLLGSALPFVTAIRKPVMLRARHGLGKSTIVYDYANAAVDGIVRKTTERRCSQMTEGDLLGLPKLNGDRTEWLLPDWLMEACESPVVLFLDELDRATLEVRQGIFELADSRKIAGHHLHPDTLIFAAINGGESGSQYQVGEMDPAELDRWTVFDVEPSVEDWLDWAKQTHVVTENGVSREVPNIHPVVRDFINQNNGHLEHKGDFEPNKVYPSRRSWHRFSDCLAKAENKNGENPLLTQGQSSPVTVTLAAAFIGLEGAIAFSDFVQKYQFQVTPQDILENGKFELLKKFQINDYLALSEKIVTHLETTLKASCDNDPKKLAKVKPSEKVLQNLCTYFCSLPSEIGMALIGNLGKTGAIATIGALHQDKAVRARIVEIIAAESKKNENEKK